MHPKETEVEVQIHVDGVAVDTLIARTRRPDLLQVYPEVAVFHEVPGFYAGLNTTQWENGPHVLEIVARQGNTTHRIASITLNIQNSWEYDFYKRVNTQLSVQQQDAKLKLLERLVRCPQCHGNTKLAGAGAHSSLVCQACGHEYSVKNYQPVMIPGESTYPVNADELDSPASNNVYPGSVLQALEEVLDRGGVALDLGSGRRLFGVAGLVQVEICTYPFTDLVNQTEELPFIDSGFDLVFCLAVTEHVERPWILAQEIQRITKPGGKVIVDSAFLQPLHGYPSHYYNMTHLALRKLFSDVEIESLQPALYQHPWFSLSWILDRVLVDLPDDQQNTLANMKVGDFLDGLRKHCRLEPSVLDSMPLPAHRIEELAAGFTLIGHKRESPDGSD